MLNLNMSRALSPSPSKSLDTSIASDSGSAAGSTSAQDSGSMGPNSLNLQGGCCGQGGVSRSNSNTESNYSEDHTGVMLDSMIFEVRFPSLSSCQHAPSNQCLAL
jgi:hypothetical protein